MKTIRLSRFLLVLLGVLLFAMACGDDDDDKVFNDPPPPDELTQIAATQSPQPAATPSLDPTYAPTKTSGTVILATTTSTQDSGLLDVLVPLFEKETGYTVKTVAVGSGQAIEQASRGDADVVFAHSPAAEKKMVEDGNGVERALVMHNDFIVVGPAGDPAGLKAEETLDDLLRAVAAGNVAFISRGDNSGTHTLELKLWTNITVDPKSNPAYEESGQGMGATLQIANQKRAYTISDRGTFLAQRENLDMEITYEGGAALVNVYHVIVANPEKFSNVNAAGARAWAAFVVRPDVQAIIGAFGVDKFGEPLFYPDAGKPEPTG